MNVITNDADDFDITSLSREEIHILRDALKLLAVAPEAPPITDVERRAYDLVCAMYEEVKGVIGEGP